MKLSDLFEARSNPQLNPKVSVNQYVLDALAQCTDKVGGIPNLFVSFTELEKLGVNPRSVHDTPIGVYAYPATYFKRRVGKNKETTDNIPYASNQPYVNIFKLSGNVVNLNKMKAKEADAYLKRLAERVGQDTIQKLTDEFNGPDRHENITDADIEYGDIAYYDKHTPGGLLWYVVWRIAGEKPKLNIAMTSLLRYMGIDAAIDIGEGIIHPNEATQVVVVNPTVIKDNKRVRNAHSPETVRRRKSEGKGNSIKGNGDVALVARLKGGTIFMPQFLEQVSSEKLLFDTLVKDKFGMSALKTCNRTISADGINYAVTKYPRLVLDVLPFADLSTAQKIVSEHPAEVNKQLELAHSVKALERFVDRTGAAGAKIARGLVMQHPHIPKILDWIDHQQDDGAWVRKIVDAWPMAMGTSGRTAMYALIAIAHNLGLLKANRVQAMNILAKIGI